MIELLIMDNSLITKLNETLVFIMKYRLDSNVIKLTEKVNATQALESFKYLWKNLVPHFNVKINN